MTPLILASIYRSIVPKVQLAATWVRFDIAFAVYSVARFCTSAEYLAGNPGFKITYRRSKGCRLAIGMLTQIGAIAAHDDRRLVQS